MVWYQVMSLPNLSTVHFEDSDFSKSLDNLNRYFMHLLTIVQFWSQWRKEYLKELRVTQYTVGMEEGI